MTRKPLGIDLTTLGNSRMLLSQEVGELWLSDIA